jgi:DNA-binding NtrC family response regulator
MTNLTVLIVDDDPVSLHVLRATLEDVGFHVSAADRPSAALRHLESQAPDLLITDLLMPEMNGLELVKAVRTRAPETCCLIITGFATNETTVEAFRAGARDLLLKPINVEEVQTRVLNAAELVQLRKEVQTLRAARDARLAPPPEAAPRARELTSLPALPGSAAPVEHAREDALQRLERLGALYRQGLISAAEFEEKKHSLLSRL